MDKTVMKNMFDKVVELLHDPRGDNVGVEA